MSLLHKGSFQDPRKMTNSSALKRYCLLFLLAIVCWRSFHGIQVAPIQENSVATVLVRESMASLEEATITDETEDKQENLEHMCDVPLKYLPKRRDIKPLLLASYPGSGNTWARHLIQSGSRYLTGSVYHDTAIMDQFPAEGKRDQSVIVTKTHFPCGGCWRIKSGALVKERQTGDLKTANSIVYIIRSPFDAILAEFKRVMSGKNHTGDVADLSVYTGSVWKDFVDFRIDSWIRNTHFYLNRHVGDNLWQDVRNREVYLIFFEQMREPSTYEDTMNGVFKYLFAHHGLSSSTGLSPDDAVKCSLHDKVGSYKRSSSTRINPYTSEQKRTICQKLLGSRNTWFRDMWGECNGSLQWER
mmetsp:Transcript_6641/g.8657  ORF Transcript_6641/g.8657 Transcript_6641/m.8657 type:complete len:358 (-) Transcript_6641:159-1232(-)